MTYIRILTLSEELKKILPSSGFDFAFDKFQKTLDLAKEALNMKLEDISSAKSEDAQEKESFTIEELLGEAKQSTLKKLLLFRAIFPAQGCQTTKHCRIKFE